MLEEQHLDKKSRKALDKPKEIAKDVVAFANANGGCLLSGIEDDKTMPPNNQKISIQAMEEFCKRINELTINVLNTIRETKKYVNGYGMTIRFPHGNLIDAIWHEIPDWQDSYELPEGLFRKNVPVYDDVVIRELLANALVHRPYTQPGDIFINLYQDRLEMHNPGPLPLGVTPQNILHTSIKRNEHLVKVKKLAIFI